MHSPVIGYFSRIEKHEWFFHFMPQIVTPLGIFHFGSFVTKSLALKITRNNLRINTSEALGVPINSSVSKIVTRSVSFKYLKYPKNHIA